MHLSIYLYISVYISVCMYIYIYIYIICIQQTELREPILSILIIKNNKNNEGASN